MTMSWDELLTNTELEVLGSGELTSDEGKGSLSSSRTNLQALRGKIVIDDSVTGIGGYAFYKCRNLTGITISNGITSIDRNAFYGCTSLTNIVIPDSVTDIGEDTFRSCNNSTTINYSGDATGAPWGATNATVVAN